MLLTSAASAFVLPKAASIRWTSSTQKWKTKMPCARISPRYSGNCSQRLAKIRLGRACKVLVFLTGVVMEGTSAVGAGKPVVGGPDCRSELMSAVLQVLPGSRPDRAAIWGRVARAILCKWLVRAFAHIHALPVPTTPEETAHVRAFVVDRIHPGRKPR